MIFTGRMPRSGNYGTVFIAKWHVIPLILMFVGINKVANIVKCADAAVTTAVSNLQTDVTELKTGVTQLTTYSQHCNDTGNTSK